MTLPLDTERKLKDVLFDFYSTPLVGVKKSKKMTDTIVAITILVAEPEYKRGFENARDKAVALAEINTGAHTRHGYVMLRPGWEDALAIQDSIRALKPEVGGR